MNWLTCVCRTSSASVNEFLVTWLAQEILYKDWVSVPSLLDMSKQLIKWRVKVLGGVCPLQIYCHLHHDLATRRR